MVKKIRDFLYELCNYLELIMAVVVVAGIVIAALGLREEFLLFWSQRGHTGSFYVFLDAIFEIIGDTSAFEDFVSIVSIALLFAIKKYIQIPPEAGKRKSIFSTCRNEMGDEKSDGEE